MSFVALLSLALIGASAQAARVEHDLDRSADFSTVRTFAWRTSASPDRALSPLTEKRLTDAVNAHLVLRGLVQVDEEPDVWLSVAGRTEEGLTVTSTSYGVAHLRGPRYGLPASYRDDARFGGFGPWVDTFVVPYTQTTIAVDLWDAATGEPLWRGTIEESLSDRPRRRTRQVDRAVRKLFRQFPIERV